MVRTFYKGTGRTIGGIAPMDENDRLFWANRERSVKEREERIARRKSDGVGK